MEKKKTSAFPIIIIIIIILLGISGFFVYRSKQALIQTISLLLPNVKIKTTKDNQVIKSEILNKKIIEWLPQANWSQVEFDNIKSPYSERNLSGMSRIATVIHDDYKLSNFPDEDYLDTYGWVEESINAVGGPFTQWSEYYKDNKFLVVYQENVDNKPPSECPCEIKIKVFIGIEED